MASAAIKQQAHHLRTTKTPMKPAPNSSPSSHALQHATCCSSLGRSCAASSDRGLGHAQPPWPWLSPPWLWAWASPLVHGGHDHELAAELRAALGLARPALVQALRLPLPLGQAAKQQRLRPRPLGQAAKQQRLRQRGPQRPQASPPSPCLSGLPSLRARSAPASAGRQR